MKPEEIQIIDKKLKAGEIYTLSSEDHLLELYYVKCWDKQYRYLLRFNGQLYYSKTSLKCLLPHIARLADKYKLKEEGTV